MTNYSCFWAVEVGQAPKHWCSIGGSGKHRSTHCRALVQSKEGIYSMGNFQLLIIVIFKFTLQYCSIYWEIFSRIAQLSKQYGELTVPVLISQDGQC